MSVYRLKGRKVWHYAFQVDGVRFRGSTRTTKEATAKKVEERVLKEVLEGTHGKLKAMACSEAFERYFQEKALGRPSEADTDAMLKRLQDHFGEKAKLTELADPDRIGEYIARRRGQPKAHVARARKRPGHNQGPLGPEDLVSNATVNREIELLRRVLRRAQTVWKRHTGPLPNWAELLLPEPQERSRELTAEEEARLFQHLRPDFHPLVRFALMTGLRLAACITLTWRQLDWDAAELRVQLKSKIPGGRLHVLPMTPALRAHLMSLKGQHPIHVFTYVCKKSGGGTKHKGRPRVMRVKGERYPFSKNGWRKPWEAALAAAEIADFRFHDNRHTAATRLLRRTGNLATVKRYLGHQSIASTMRYAHVTTDDLRQAMESVEAPAVAAVPDSEAKKGNDNG